MSPVPGKAQAERGPVPTMKPRGTLRTRRQLNTLREGSENPEPGRRHPKPQDLNSLGHMDSFPKKEGTQIRDFP